VSGNSLTFSGWKPGSAPGSNRRWEEENIEPILCSEASTFALRTAEKIFYHGWTRINLTRPLAATTIFWTAAGSEAPRRFWKQPAVRKAVSPLRSSLRCASPRQAATTVHIFVVRARSCRIVLRMLVGRVTPCAPWFVFERAAGRGLPALPIFNPCESVSTCSRFIGVRGKIKSSAALCILGVSRSHVNEAALKAFPFGCGFAALRLRVKGFRPDRPVTGPAAGMGASRSTIPAAGCIVPFRSGCADRAFLRCEACRFRRS